MDRSALTRSLVVAALVALVVSAGCLGLSDGPDSPGETTDGATDGEDGGDAAANATEGNATTGNDSTVTDAGSVTTDPVDDVNATDDAVDEGPTPPATLDERLIAGEVRRDIKRYRDNKGFRDVRHTQGLAVIAGEMNREIASDDPDPPVTVSGGDLGWSEDQLLGRFLAGDVGECERQTREVAGTVAAVRDVTEIRGGTTEDPETTIADEVVFALTQDPSTGPALERPYRFVGVHALYRNETGYLYVTVNLC